MASRAFVTVSAGLGGAASDQPGQGRTGLASGYLGGCNPATYRTFTEAHRHRLPVFQVCTAPVRGISCRRHGRAGGSGRSPPTLPRSLPWRARQPRSQGAPAHRLRRSLLAIVAGSPLGAGVPGSMQPGASPLPVHESACRATMATAPLGATRIGAAGPARRAV